MPKRLLLSIALIFATAALPLHAFADTVFQADLSGTLNVPPCMSSATGKVTFVLNKAQTEVFYIIEINNPSGGREIATLIQNAPPGQNGPVFKLLPLGLMKDGVWNVTPFQVNELTNGRVYVAFYTIGYPAGELRGNLGEPPSPTENSSWSAVKSLF